MPLEDIVDVEITAATAVPSRAGFGTPLILASHEEFVDRVREYKSLTGVGEDFETRHPVYLAAQAIFSQKPRPAKLKVGRRLLTPTQTMRITPTLTTEGLVLEFSILGTDFTYTIPAAATVASIVTALVALINASLRGGVTATDDVTHVTITANVAADDDAIATAAVFIGGAAPVEILGAAFDGVVNDLIIYPPKTLRVVFNADADWDATTLLVTGLDEDGLPQTENIAIPNGGSATVVGVKRWTQITKLNIPAQTAACAGTVGLSALAGSLFSYTIDSVGLELKDVTADPGLATDLAAVIAADDDWYGLCIDSNSEAEINAAAAAIEAVRKIFVASTADTRVKVAAETTDVGSDLQANAYARTAIIWNNDTLGFAGAAWLGKMLPDDPGSSTWAFKTLAGITFDALTAAEESALDDGAGGGKFVNHYTRVAGINMTRYGKTAAGEFIDVTIFIDWLTARLKERFVALLANAKKVPYTDASGDLIRAQVLAQLYQGVSRGGLAASPEPTCTVPKVADVDPLDRAARLFPDVEFSGTLAGAIHKLEISGSLSV